FIVGGPVGDFELLLCHGTVCVVGKMRDLILQLSKSSIYSTKPTADEIPEPQNIQLVTRLNGREVQRDSTANMIHSIAFLIAYISTFTVLSAGDVILTGSPGGVGKKRTPPLFLHDGDVVEVEIEHIGVLHNVVRDAGYTDAAAMLV
ncbi:fumarylacetoacetate hydrolase family protein, partial [Klebsiella pneumoniae]|nr:fumarylacetoacetate hydrolase family protein [Klebsiella pneumoniae]